MGDHYSILPKEVNEERKLNCQTKHKTPKLEKQAHRNIKKKICIFKPRISKDLGTRRVNQPARFVNW